MKSAGCQWLKDYFKLSGYILTHSSFIGSNPHVELTSKGNVEEIYGSKYAPAEDIPLYHVEFSLKYDDLNLDFLQAVFKNIPCKHVEEFIEKSPSGKYARRIGFLYELLTLHKLKLARSIDGNYTDLLDPEKYITSISIKDSRWRINNNLLGDTRFCPIIRRKKELNELVNIDISQKIQLLRTGYPPELFKRATQFLYKKETKSSYEIEQEVPSEDRVDKFIALLRKAGTDSTFTMLKEDRLVSLQGAIVDPRFAVNGFRDFQNYIGQTHPNFQQQIHYICPPPAFVDSLMIGLQQSAVRTEGVNPVVRAAIISFGFVFIHPFDDGNGRIHRFLIHDTLVHDQVVPDDMIIPVSAHMLNNMKDYDAVLERYSEPLMQRVKYQLEEDESIAVSNPAQVEGYYRYPDLTEQVIYLLKTIHATLEHDMPEELLFLQRYDEAKRALQMIVDMPDRDINWMLIYLHQNKGTFPKRRRDRFPKLTDDEIADMQNAYRKVFEIDME